VTPITDAITLACLDHQMSQPNPRARTVRHHLRPAEIGRIRRAGQILAGICTAVIIASWLILAGVVGLGIALDGWAELTVRARP